ncbi:MAG: hypothetical protein OEZ01_01585 [Candidatus Heimdallarchaeota archaeon]|nr:hypothetical protein [Candidatus Heimdallarchaeota archaeon]MDH5644666.1 hypothetical protein [Candidatus Heimdallarchaeota archaeon]
MNKKNSKKVELFQEGPQINNLDESFLQKRPSYKKVIKEGIILGFILFIILLVFYSLFIIIFVGKFTYDVYIFFSDLLFLMSSLVFFSAGVSSYFGPSPVWAKIRSMFMGYDIYPKSTTDSLILGLKRSATGFCLLLLSILITI